MDTSAVSEAKVARAATSALGPNIASVPAPSTDDLVEAHVKRLSMQQGQI